MKRARNRVVLLAVCGTCCIITAGNSSLSQDDHEEFWKMLQTVQDILGGRNIQQAKAAIGRGASLICGSNVADLTAVVTGESTSCMLADTSYHGIQVQGRTNTSEDMGFIVLKTVQSDTTRVRYHSVVFLKDSVGHYKIILWHSGRQGR
jgi:hypothetical protein